MPKGISETDVHQAADALVAQGERPTVERIRAHLGTGSPNTVTRWLETWWQRLGGRLRPASRQLETGEPPANLTALAQQWWTLAVDHAHAVATQALADAHAAVQVRTDALAANEAQISRDRIAWAGERAGLSHARDLAQQGVSDLEAHLQALGRQLDELRHQYAQVDAEREGLLAQFLAVQAAARDAAIAANAERTAGEQAHRAVEDRWLQEVDRARQETARTAAMVSQRDKVIERMTVAATDVQERLRAAEAEAATQQARADTFERVHAAMAQTKKAEPRRPRSTKATPARRRQ